MKDGPTALYRYYDGKDRLLYVGISGALAGREKSHIDSSRWMDLTGRSEVARYSTRAEALVAEREAIETEQPLFNKQHNDTPEARRWLDAYLREIGRTDLIAPPALPASVRAQIEQQPPAAFTAVQLSILLVRLLAVLEGLIRTTEGLTEAHRDLERRVAALEPQRVERGA